MTESTARLIVEKDRGVGRITLDNQAWRNAMTIDMWSGIPEAVGTFENDPDVRVIVIQGAGGEAFCAGADISQFENNRASKDAIVHYDETVSAALAAIKASLTPTIAKVEGFCIGGGLALATCCDLRLSNDAGRFSVPAAKLGIGYRVDSVKPLVDLVGAARAKEIMFTARLFTAEEALAMGLVNQVLAADGLDAYVDDYTDRMTRNAPLSIAAAKIAVEELTGIGEADIARSEDAVRACFMSEDYVEGRRAYMEKRKPVFRGR